jgi:hypothetical protein
MQVSSTLACFVVQTFAVYLIEELLLLKTARLQTSIIGFYTLSIMQSVL